MNWLQSIIRKLIPPARRPVTWRAAIPLFAFLVIYVGALVFLTQTNRVEFLYPLAFGLLIFTPWIWWMQAAGHSGLTPQRGHLAAIVRLALAGLLICVLAVPRAVKTSDIVSVMYSVDVSDSVSEAKDAALEIVASTVVEKPPKDETGMVIFGRTPAVEYPPRETFPFEGFTNSQVGKDATNLQQSLSLSAAMLPEENRSRIVLISDGTETVGELKQAVSELQARDIQVDVIPIEYESHDKEVLLERLDLPRLVRLGETYEAAAVLSSLKDGEGTLVLTQTTADSEPTELARLPVEFKAGKSRITVPIKVDAPGYYEYNARIEVSSEDDVCLENNAVENYLYIEGPGKILLVHSQTGDPSEWKYIEDALQQGDREVTTMASLKFPNDPLQLMPFDVVIFADVPADELFATQIQAVHDAVRNLGIGFAMVGGPNSFGPGGYQNSPIEDCLPISMEISKKKILPKGALVIILHTCEFPQGNSWAKKITKEAIKVLSAEDDVGAIGYGAGGNEWIFELTPASKYDELVPKINAAQIGDMPDFTSTMEMGLKGLKASDASSRHMIIISDGDPPMPPPAAIQKFRDSQTSISTVAVFPHGGRDTLVLNAIATQTGGRYYFPPDPRQLPKIFIKEAKTLRRNQLQKRTFYPKLLNDDPILRGIQELPPLHGYVLTSEKEDPRATVLLSAPPKESDLVADDSDVDPILAVWRYGLGATAAFTSDLTGATDDSGNRGWGKDWVAWDQFQQLVTQMVTRIGRVRREQFLRVYTYVNGNDGVVVVEDFHPEEMLLDMKVTVTSADGFNKSQPIRQIAPRRYQTTIPLRGQGRYQVQVSAQGGDRKETAYGGFIVSYSPEYLRFEANPIVLKEIAEQTGGEKLDGDATPEELAKTIYGRRQPKRSSRPVFDWFLMALACLIPLDVAIRRVQVDFGAFRRMFRKRESESTATMGTLLQKKQAVRSSMEDRRRETTASPRPERPMVPRATPPKPTGSKATSEDTKPKPTEAKPPSSDDGSTTSRLLAMKRKREEDGDG